jgi:hypothetical protein
MDLHEGRTEDVRERRGGGEGVEVGEGAAPGSQVLAGLQGAPEGQRAGAVHGMGGIPDGEQVRDQPQRGHHGEQQVKGLKSVPRPRTTGCEAHRPRH